MTTQSYVGTKHVYARPMTRLEYNEHRGWNVPPDEDGSDEGYLVEYKDGGASNHPDHKGYISWSPKDIFERSYKVEPKNHIERMEIEAQELSVKSQALGSFLGSPSVPLSTDELGLLTQQQEHMMKYLGVLNARLILARSLTK